LTSQPEPNATQNSDNGFQRSETVSTIKDKITQMQVTQDMSRPLKQSHQPTQSLKTNESWDKLEMYV